MKRYLIYTFLAAQALWVLADHVLMTRYFAWAPLQSITRYTIDVSVAGRTLTQGEACRRYGFIMNTCGVDTRSPRHVIDIIQQYEQTLGQTEPASVKLAYSKNGHAKEEWVWPRQ